MKTLQLNTPYSFGTTSSIVERRLLETLQLPDGASSLAIEVSPTDNIFSIEVRGRIDPQSDPSRGALLASIDLEQDDSGFTKDVVVGITPAVSFVDVFLINHGPVDSSIELWALAR